MIRPLGTLMGLALLLGAHPAIADDGTRPTILRNASEKPVYWWVDNSGRGLESQAAMKDGRGGSRLKPSESGIASQTNLFDAPTLRVYDEQGICIAIRKVHYIPVVKDESNRYRFDGTNIVPE